MSARGRWAWAALAALALVIAVAAIARWGSAIALRGPVMYGEGMVAHAAILARTGAEYAAVEPPAFVAANYTPLYFHLAAPDPFLWGRVVSIAATLFVAGAIAWRARGAPAVVRVALAAGWLALAPVAIWGPAVRPDLLALACSVAAVLVLDRDHRRAGLAASFCVLAVAAKPTAALVAVALAIELARRRAAMPLATYLTVGVVGLAALLIVTPGGAGALREHVIDRNALPWDAQQALLLAVLGLLVCGAVVVGAALLRPRGPLLAYLGASLVLVVLGGREGATINYLLDASAAGALVLAANAARLAAVPIAPLVGIAQLALGLALLDPIGLRVGPTTTGSWDPPSRLDVARRLPPGEVLAEESGLLIAIGREPLIDDLFLWARHVERGSIDPAPLVRAVREGRFVAVVSEIDLDRLDDAPAYARQRWPRVLVEAVVARYAPAPLEGGVYVRRPR